MKHGKKYVESAKALDKAKLYEPNEALGTVCQLAKAKFDETVEAHIRLGVDSRHADQQVRGAVVLPNGTGKSVRVLVFCKEDKYEAAKAAGAEYVGGLDLVEKIQKIAETKMPDLNAASLEAAMSMIAGTARSMGVVVAD